MKIEIQRNLSRFAAVKLIATKFTSEKKCLKINSQYELDINYTQGFQIDTCQFKNLKILTLELLLFFHKHYRHEKYFIFELLCTYGSKEFGNRLKKLHGSK